MFLLGVCSLLTLLARVMSTIFLLSLSFSPPISGLARSLALPALNDNGRRSFTAAVFPFVRSFVSSSVRSLDLAVTNVQRIATNLLSGPARLLGDLLVGFLVTLHVRGLVPGLRADGHKATRSALLT